MPKRIRWTKGMRLTDDVMRASDQCFIDFAKNAFILASSGRFGLLTTSKPFELSLDISNGMVDVVSLNCTAITSGGDLIEAHYDTKYNNSFDTRIQIPAENDVKEYILTINVECDKWSDTNNGYEEQAYSFKLIPVNSPIGNNAMPIAHIVDSEYGGWRIDDVEFVPPCLSVRAHPRFNELLDEFHSTLTAIDQKVASLLKTGNRRVFMVFWPIIQQLLIEVDKECDNMSPITLMAKVQKCVSAFLCGCDLDENLNIENAETLRGYIVRPFNYREAYTTIKEGLGICFRISENIENLQTTPTPQPVKPGLPEAPTIDPTQMTIRCATKTAKVQLTNNAPGATVYYTTDGSEPNESSKKGLSVVLQNGFKKERVNEPDMTATIKAKAILNGISSRTNTFQITLIKDISIWNGYEI